MKNNSYIVPSTNRPHPGLVVCCVAFLLGESIACVIPTGSIWTILPYILYLSLISLSCQELFKYLGQNSHLLFCKITLPTVCFGLGVGVLSCAMPAQHYIRIGSSFGQSVFRMYGKVLGLQGRSKVGEMRISFEAEDRGASQGVYLVTLADLPWLATSEIAEGSCIRLLCRASRDRIQSAYQNPFSYLSYLRRRGYVTHLRGKNVELCEDTSISPPKKGFSQDLLLSAMVRDLGYGDGLAILVASVLGKADLLGETVLDVFRNTGTIHLLVVSGFHVGTLYWLFELLLIRGLSFSLILRSRNLVIPAAALGSFLGTFWYSWLVGFSPPSVRALFALGLYILARVNVRRLNTTRALLLNLVFVNIFWPGSLFEAGVQFTFAALIGLVWGNRLWSRLERKWSFKNSITSAMLLNLVVCITCWICTAPLSYIWFGQINPMSPLVNAIFAVPFTFVTVVGGGISILWWYLSLPGGCLLVQAVSWVTERIFHLLELFN